MRPVPVSLDIYRGDHFELFYRLRHRVWNQALNDGFGAYEAGAYINLNGYSVVAHIRPVPDSEILLAQFDVTVFPDTEATRGSVLMVLPSPVTRLLPVTPAGSPAAWDCQVTNPAGEPNTYYAGPVAISPDVTR